MWYWSFHLWEIKIQMPSKPKYRNLLLKRRFMLQFWFVSWFCFELSLLIPLYVCVWQWGWPAPQFLKWLQVKPFHVAEILTPTSSQQLILPECSPHIDLCSSFSLITADSESFSPSLSQNSGCSCNFLLLPHLFFLPQQSLQGKEEWKPRNFSSFQSAERNRGKGSTGLILVSNLGNLGIANVWTRFPNYMYCWFLRFVPLVVSVPLLLEKNPKHAVAEKEGSIKH